MQGGELGTAIHSGPADALLTWDGVQGGRAGLAGLLHSTVKGIQARAELAIADISPFHQSKHTAWQNCTTSHLEPFPCNTDSE